MKKDRNFSIKARRRRESMGMDSIWKLLLRFSGPAIISMTAASSYNLVDTIFIGRLGPAALAAMSVSFPLVLSFVALSSGTAVGVTSLIARSLGAGDDRKADYTAGVAISLCFLISGLIAIVCLPFLDGIVHVLGARGEVISLAVSYMSILICGNIFSNLLMMFGSLIRVDGNPVFSSSISITASLLNIVLDPVIIFGLGPVPQMGIRGAAIATVIAQTIGTAAHLCYILSGRSGYTFHLRNFIPHLEVISGIYRVGAASIVRSGAQIVVMGVINNTAAAFGVIPLAIIGILIKIWRFVQMPVLGLGQGVLPILGFSYGARKKSRVAEVLIKAATAGSVWTLFCWAVIMAFPFQVLSVFSDNTALLGEGVYALRLYFLVIFILALRMMPNFFFQGIGKGLPAVILMASQNIVFMMLPVLILPHYFGLTGLWIAFPVADALGLIFGQLWMHTELRRQAIRLLGWKNKVR